MILSSTFGVFFGATHRDDFANLTEKIIDNPILGIEKTYAEDGSSGCSGSACDAGAIVYPTPLVSDFVITVVEQ